MSYYRRPLGAKRRLTLQESSLIFSSIYFSLLPLCHFRLLRRPVTSLRDLHKPMAAPVRFPRTLSSLKCSASISLDAYAGHPRRRHNMVSFTSEGVLSREKMRKYKPIIGIYSFFCVYGSESYDGMTFISYICTRRTT